MIACASRPGAGTRGRERGCRAKIRKMCGTMGKRRRNFAPRHGRKRLASRDLSKSGQSARLSRQIRRPAGCRAAENGSSDRTNGSSHRRSCHCDSVHGKPSRPRPATDIRRPQAGVSPCFFVSLHHRRRHATMPPLYKND